MSLGEEYRKVMRNGAKSAPGNRRKKEAQEISQWFNDVAKTLPAAMAEAIAIARGDAKSGVNPSRSSRQPKLWWAYEGSINVSRLDQESLPGFSELQRVCRALDVDFECQKSGKKHADDPEQKFVVHLRPQLPYSKG